MYQNMYLVVATCMCVLFHCEQNINEPENDTSSFSVDIHLSPSSDSCFFQGDTITGTIKLPSDTIVASHLDSIVWVSDKDGQIGTGMEFNTHTLSINTHTIVATLTYKGNTVQDSVRIHVLPHDSVMEK